MSTSRNRSKKAQLWNGPQRLELEAEKAQRQLREFVRQAWHVPQPETPFIDGIHLDAICQHLQAVSEGQVQNLIINVPPGHAKSLLTAVF